MSENVIEAGNELEGIAVVGLSLRFPMAETVDQFWSNIVNKKDCISTISISDARNAGINESILKDSRYVPRLGRIEHPDAFDSAFFGYTPREASLIDPQHRIFLQCGWEAIESAGYNPKQLDCRTGVFGGCGMNYYLLNNLIANKSVQDTSNEIQMVIGSDKDFLTTRLSYKLNLRGPSFDIQTACSTSLVAIHTACQNLLTWQCDLALAGGVFLQIPWWNGYLITDGDIRSPDGVCRPFDAGANGTIFGEGAGVVVLKRLQDAINDRNHIYAVVRGSAINNDGAQKAGYTVPGIDGQTEVITMALESAMVNAADIGYVETHGTGTPLGDPVEMAGLTNAFRQYTSKCTYCAIGSVKSSIGHLDAAAGVAGFIRTVLSLYHKKIPPLLNFRTPNPLLDIGNTPFYIPETLIDWKTEQGKRRYAGVSSLGVGGTNAHVILEEAPEYIRIESKKRFHFIPFSAPVPEVVTEIAGNLSGYFRQNGSESIADGAYTLQNGRQHFPFRNFVIADSHETAADQLEACSLSDNPLVASCGENSKIVFMFSGQGAQYIYMGKDLYESIPRFRQVFDKCCEILIKLLHLDLREIIFFDSEENRKKLIETNITQPALFSIEYALVKVWEELGVQPSALIGHSIGEYVAACCSGVFTLEDALYLVTERGRIMHNQPAGGMLSLRMTVEEAGKVSVDGTEVAVVNSTNSVVIAGTHEALKKVQEKCETGKYVYRPVQTSHAFHSSMMSGAIPPFMDSFKKVRLNKPTLPYISNVSGTWITSEQAYDAAYYGEHLRNTVRFSDGILRLLEDGFRVFVEIGPGNTLVSFVTEMAAQYKIEKPDIKVVTVTSTRHFKESVHDVRHMLNSAGQLWKSGVGIAFEKMYADEKRTRVSLPVYPFRKTRHWIDNKTRVNHGLGLPCNTAAGPAEDENDAAAEHRHKVEKESALTQKNDKKLKPIKPIVSEIWKNLLGMDQIDTTVSFFELGGDSIWAAQMLSRVREKTGIEISTGTLYKAPTLNLLTQEIEMRMNETEMHNRSKPVRSDRETGIPLSSSQMRMWYLYQLEPQSPAFNLATVFNIEGQLDVETARKAAEMVILRHDSLRCTFRTGESGPVITINSTAEFAFEVLDLTGSKTDDETWVEEVKVRSVKSYNLQTGPLVRVCILRISSEHSFLVIMTHHIISDGWSMGVFLRDFAHFYRAQVSGTTSPLPELPFRFADYAQWQASESLKADPGDIDFWKQELSGELPVLELPADRVRPKNLSFKGATIRFSIDPEISTKLDAFSRNEQTTLFSLLLTIYYVLLSRYSGQTDIIIGAPVANRNNVELENMFGFFLNMIPLRIRCDKNKPFNQLFYNVKSTVHDAFAHKDVPFNTLIEVLNVKRDLNHAPVFQTMFAFQNFPIKSESIGNTTITPQLADRGASEYDVSLYMWLNDTTLEGIFEYNTDLFDHSSMQRFADHFVNIASFVSERTDVACNAIGILRESERKMILQTWNDTRLPFPSDMSVPQLFEKAVVQFSDATSLIANDRSFSYRELDVAANCIAARLIENGIKHGDAVGICTSRHFGMVASLLGILKSGAAYVPLDPNYPRDRLTYMINDASILMIITDDANQAMVSSIAENVSILMVDPGVSGLYDTTEGTQLVSVPPECTAYIIYTSGSTGKPKGVRIPHSAVVNFLFSMRTAPGLKENDIVAAVTTLSFDISVLEIFLPLITGASCLLIMDEVIRDGIKLLQTIKGNKVTVMQGTPSTWRLLISAGWKGSPDLKALCGGEPLPSDLLKELYPRVYQLWNMYGPTETTVWTTCQLITDPESPVLIGRPIHNTTAYILDETVQPLPVGVHGELYIGGDGLAQGYHNRPELTEAKFISNPFSNGKLYKTGDLARFHEDGKIECLGRIDSQVKIRGFRIELGEIEHVISTHSGVRQSVAVCKEYAPGDLRLLLYYVLHTSGAFTATELRKHLRSFLPDYMIPQHFIELETMPLTPAGKIDRKGLQLPIEIHAAIQSEKKAPVTPGELYLASIWREYLGIAIAYVNDTFFDLGGHSLISIQVISRIKTETGIEVQPKSLMFNTLGEIASIYKLKDNENKNVNTRKNEPIVSRVMRFFRRERNLH